MVQGIVNTICILVCRICDLQIIFVFLFTPHKKMFASLRCYTLHYFPKKPFFTIIYLKVYRQKSSPEYLDIHLWVIYANENIKTFNNSLIPIKIFFTMKKAALVAKLLIVSCPKFPLSPHARYTIICVPSCLWSLWCSSK